MVDRKGAFQPVRGDVAGAPVPADIVDQHVDPRQASSTSLASRRTCAWEDRSATNTSTFLPLR